MFDGGKATACLYQKNASQAVRDRVQSALQRYKIQELFIQSNECKPSDLLAEDVIAVERGSFLKEDVAYASALIKEIEFDHIKPLLSITGSQVETALQSIDAKRKKIEADINHGSLDGFALVELPAVPTGSICGAVHGDLDAHETILMRLADPSIARLRQHLALDAESFEDVFKDVQRSKCSAVYAGADDLKLLLEALQRDHISYQIYEETISAAQVKEEAQRISDTKSGEEKAALQRLHNAEEARTLEALRSRDLASTRQAQQAVLRAKFGKLAASSAAEISNEVSDYLKGGAIVKSGESGSDVPRQFPTLSNWYEESLRDHWDLMSVNAELDDFGSVDWKGRPLEAAFSTIHVRLKNAIVGDYRDGCYKLGRVIDHEFKVTRDPVAVPCGNAEPLTSWKLEHSFRSVWNLD